MLRGTLALLLLLGAPLGSGIAAMEISPFETPNASLATFPPAGRFDAPIRAHFNVTGLAGSVHAGAPPPQTTVLAQLPANAAIDSASYPPDPPGWTRSSDWARVDDRWQVLYETNLSQMPTTEIRQVFELSAFDADACTSDNAWRIVVTVPGGEPVERSSPLRCDRTLPDISLVGSVATPRNTVPSIRARVMEGALAQAGGADDVRGYFEGASSALQATVTKINATDYSFSSTALADGAYILRVSANDTAGNSATADLSGAAFVLDQAPPVPTLVTGPGAAVVSSVPTLRVSVADAHPGEVRAYFVRAGVSTPATSTSVATGVFDITDAALDDGAYGLRLTANDTVGNGIDTTLAASEFTLDTAAPEILLVTGPPAASLRLVPTLRARVVDASLKQVSGADDVRGYFVGSAGTIQANAATIDGTVGNFDFTASALPDDAYELRVTANDTAGHGGDVTLAGTSFLLDQTAPVLAQPSRLDAEATAPSGAIVAFPLPLAAESGSGLDGSVACAPVSGSTFALGGTNVTCAARDVAGNDAIPVTFLVRVSDTTGPSIDEPRDLTIEATGPMGANVSYPAPGSHDAVDGDAPASCAPASASAFALGTTLAVCTKTDAAGNAATERAFRVSVVDTTPPTIAPRPDIDLGSAAEEGQVVSFDAPLAFDLVDGATTASCSPASGTFFSLGESTIVCGATDAAGNVASPTTFKIRLGRVPLGLAARADITAEATNSSGALVTFVAPAATGTSSRSATVDCAPASGSTFALGSTLVTCTATTSNESATRSFRVDVRDTTAPVIASMPDVDLEAANASGARFLYDPPAASDAVDGESVAVCAPASGEVLALGDTMIRCEAVDAAGNAALATQFVVRVRDTTAPAIGAEDATSPSPNGTVAFSTSDAVSAPAAAATLTFANGSTVALTLTAEGASYRDVPEGDHTVEIRAVDAAGNVATKTVRLRVQIPPPAPSAPAYLLSIDARFEMAATAQTGEPVRLEAMPDTYGRALAYSWRFADGATLHGRVVTYAWTAPGSQVVQLVVSAGAQSSASSRAIEIRAPASATPGGSSGASGAAPSTTDGSGEAEPPATDVPLPGVRAIVPSGVLRSPATIHFELDHAELVFWRLPGAPDWDSSNPAIISGEGTVTIDYYALGASGRSITHAVTLRLDALSPEVANVQLPGAPTAGSPFTLALQIDDVSDVVARAEIAPAGGGALTVVDVRRVGESYEASVPGLAPGEYTLTIVAMDSVGRETRHAVGSSFVVADEQPLAESSVPGAAVEDLETPAGGVFVGLAALAGATLLARRRRS